MTIYVFDMDGTLTPARLPMTTEFAANFYAWQQKHDSFLATGSDLKKVKEQLPESVISAFTGVYSSMGNMLTAKGELIYQNHFKPRGELLAMLEDFRKKTVYTGELYPNYIEERTGMINFSVLGRNCPYNERERYKAWDCVNKEREKIAEAIRNAFPEYEVAVGGSISMDITPLGCGKEQIARHIRETYPDDKIIFFGDKTFKGGNDYELANELSRMGRTEVVQVNGYTEIMAELARCED